MAALLNWQYMRSHAKLQNPLQLCSAHGDFPVGRPDAQDEKTYSQLAGIQWFRCWLEAGRVGDFTVTIK